MDFEKEPFEPHYVVEVALKTDDSVPRNMVPNLSNKRDGNISKGRRRKKAFTMDN